MLEVLETSCNARLVVKDEMRARKHGKQVGVLTRHNQVLPLPGQLRTNEA